jgi:hypothetical protein
MPKPTYRIPRPQRLRRIQHSFAWIDHRLLRSEFVHVMTHQDQSLYLFLALAADCNGVSFYRKEKAADILGLDAGEFEVARDRLIDMGLLAFEAYSAVSVNGFYQLLPVDGQPPDFASMTPTAPGPLQDASVPIASPRVAPVPPRAAPIPPRTNSASPTVPKSEAATESPAGSRQAWPPSVAELTARLAAAFKTV